MAGRYIIINLLVMTLKVVVTRYSNFEFGKILWNIYSHVNLLLMTALKLCGTQFLLVR
jgi:hypothetical protein